MDDGAGGGLVLGSGSPGRPAEGSEEYRGLDGGGRGRTALQRPNSGGSRTAGNLAFAGGGDGAGCYNPGCRKDANCACEICLASINATRDLLPPEAASARRCFAVAARDRRPGSRPLFLGHGGTPPTPGSEDTEPWTPPPP